METIIRATDGREFPPHEAERAEAYEQIRKRLANLTALDSAGGAPRPIAMLLLDPFQLDEVELAERIAWAQEMVKAWADVLRWQQRDEAGEWVESWKWQDVRIDGAAGPVDKVDEVAGFAEYDPAAAARAVMDGEIASAVRLATVKDPDGLAARASGQPIWFAPGRPDQKLPPDEAA